MALFPYNVNNLLGGAVRVLWAPLTVALPAGPKDVIAQESPYAPKTGWKDFGAARDASSYERGMNINAWNIQQSNAAVVEEVSEVTRHISVSIAEITPDALQIVEQAAAQSTVAAATGVGAQKKVAQGEITSLQRYRIAFIAMRDTSAGVVTETAVAVPPSGTRGRFATLLGYSCGITADAVTLEQAKATESAIQVVFNFYPVSTQPAGEEYGAWYLEDAGALT